MRQLWVVLQRLYFEKVLATTCWRKAAGVLNGEGYSARKRVKHNLPLHQLGVLGKANEIHGGDADEGLPISITSQGRT